MQANAMPDTEESIAPRISRLGDVPPGTGFARPSFITTDPVAQQVPNDGGGTGPDDLSTTYRNATPDELAAGKGFWYNVTGGGYYGKPPGDNGRTTLPVAQQTPSDTATATDNGGTLLPLPQTTRSSPSSVDDTAAQLLSAATGGGLGGNTGGTDISGAGHVPAGVPAATVATGSSTSPLLLLFLVALAVGGYVLYVHYKGKIKHKEGA